MTRIALVLMAVVLAHTLACAGPAEPSSADFPQAAADAPDGAGPLEVGTGVTAPPVAEPGPPAKTRKVVVLDPGHGGAEVGAAAFGVVEKGSNLDMALRVEQLLLAQGFDVVLTRRTDSRAAPQAPGFTATRSDLQTRIDLANAAGGDVFVSLHSNGSSDPGQKGVEAWYDSNRDFASEGKLLAGLLVSNVVRELRDYGYSTPDRGLFDGKCFRQRGGRCFTLYVIGGPRATTRQEVMSRGGNPEEAGFNGADLVYSRATNMPSALVELLIITNSEDAAVLRQEGGRDAIARAIAEAIAEFLGLPDEGA